MLTVLSRPINRYKALVIGAMFVALVAIFTIPLAIGVLRARRPGRGVAYLVAVVTVLTIGAIEIVRFFHRRYVARELAKAGVDRADSGCRSRGARGLDRVGGVGDEVPRPGRRPQREQR